MANYIVKINATVIREYKVDDKTEEDMARMSVDDVTSQGEFLGEEEDDSDIEDWEETNE